MIGIWLLYGASLATFTSSSTILATPRDDGPLRLYAGPRSDLEYVSKRDEAEPKERRAATSGTSFIRFGRGDPTTTDVDAASQQVRRHPRFKSPDIVIRFGRAGKPMKRARNDLNIVRFGRNAQTLPAEMDLTALCPELLAGEMSFAGRQSRLLRLCGFLTSLDDDHRSLMDLVDEDDSPAETD